MSLFPTAAQPVDIAEQTELPLCREIAWDFAKDCPIFYRGEPMEVTGKAAVQVWVWKALRTERYRHEIYSWAFGCELQGLIGQSYAAAMKEAEAPRYLRECLLVNPYITGVKEIYTSFLDGVLTISGTVETVYGEVEASVTV